MKRIKKIRRKKEVHPIITFTILICIVILVSGIFNLFDVTMSYNKLSSNGTYIKELVAGENLFSLHGIKIIFSNAVSSFASFTPLSMLIISLMGIGIMDKTGFLDSLFYVLTKRASKKKVSFILSLICILSSISGDLGFVVMIPLGALLFKYGKRHPKAGVVCSFASLSCGYGVNALLSSVDTSLILYTNEVASLFIKDYNVGIYSYVFVMILVSIVLAYIISWVTENIVVPKLGHYELMDETCDYLTKREKRGLLISLFFGVVYLLVIVYNIIPYAPLGGNFLDYSQKYYIDKLFGYNSFFSQGYVFVVVLLFFILGFTYGINTRKIKDQTDLFDSLRFSLDKIGNGLVLMFFASSLIFIFKKSNIGTLITAYFANLINNGSMRGLVLVIFTYIASGICTIVMPGSVSKWSILSGSVVPAFMNEGLTPEFAQLVFRAGESFMYGLTPLMAYYVIYLMFMQIYSVGDDDGVFSSMKYLLPYAGYTFLVWLVVIIFLYITGIPYGVGGVVGI